jgi:hypothetical protein
VSTQFEPTEGPAAVLTLTANQNAPGAGVPVPLARDIKRAGMLYREIFRKRHVAIYGAKGKGSRIEYEVFEVQTLPAGEFNGSQYPLRESLPSTSSWGESGWTFTNNSHCDPLAAALAKAQQIASRNRVGEAERKASESAVTISANGDQ